MADEALLNVVDPPAQRFARTHTATVSADVDLYDTGGIPSGRTTVEVSLSDPTLTTQQRNQLTSLVKQMLQFKGMIG